MKTHLKECIGEEAYLRQDLKIIVEEDDEITRNEKVQRNAFK